MVSTADWSLQSFTDILNLKKKEKSSVSELTSLYHEHRYPVHVVKLLHPMPLNTQR